MCGDDVRALVLDPETVPMIDTTAANMLRDLSRELESRGVRTIVVGDIGQVRDVLRVSGADGSFSRVQPDIDAAVAAIRSDRDAG